MTVRSAAHAYLKAMFPNLKFTVNYVHCEFFIDTRLIRVNVVMAYLLLKISKPLPWIPQKAPLPRSFTKSLYRGFVKFLVWVLCKAPQ